MTGIKRTAAIVALIIVILAGVGWLVHTVASMQGVQVPDRILNMPVEKIDIETFELFTLPKSEWKKVKGPGNLWENPNTGKDTVTDVRLCPVCGKKAPGPVVTDEMLKDPGALIAAAQSWQCARCASASPPGLR